MPVAALSESLTGRRLALPTLSWFFQGYRARRYTAYPNRSMVLQNPGAKLISVPFQNNRQLWCGPNARQDGLISLLILYISI